LHKTVLFAVEMLIVLKKKLADCPIKLFDLEIVTGIRAGKTLRFVDYVNQQVLLLRCSSSWGILRLDAAGGEEAATGDEAPEEDAELADAA